jgi:hypothetical protein
VPTQVLQRKCQIVQVKYASVDALFNPLSDANIKKQKIKYKIFVASG